MPILNTTKLSLMATVLQLNRTHLSEGSAIARLLVNVADAPAGYYYIKIEGDNITGSAKLIKL